MKNKSKDINLRITYPKDEKKSVCQALISTELFEMVNKKRAHDELSWPELITMLLKAYLVLNK